MLTSVECQNFRALESFRMELAPLTAIVGPNGVGKTAVLEAIDIVLGARWPNLGRIRDPEDFTGFHTGRELIIQVTFDPPFVHTDALKAEREIESLRFSCRPYKKTGKWGEAGDLRDEFDPLDHEGELAAVRAFCNGSVISFSTTGQAATRWNHVVAGPVYLDEEDEFGRLPVGVVTLASTHPEDKSVLGRQLPVVRRTVIPKLTDRAAQLLRPGKEE